MKLLCNRNKSSYNPKLRRSNCIFSRYKLLIVSSLVALFTNLLVYGAPITVISLSSTHSPKARVMAREQMKGQQVVKTMRGGSNKQTIDVKTASWGSRVRNALFPIHGDEVKKFLLIGAIKFFVILALTLTRDNKDTMVVTECGAEAIAFLKVRSFMLCTSVDGRRLTTHTTLFHSSDLRSVASSNSFYWHIFKNGVSS